MLQLRGASYRYPTGAAPALGPLNLEIPAGQLTLLTGPTGCGKSTLLRLAAGLLQRHGHGEQGGEILVTGLDPAELSPSERARRVGFVSQEPSDQIVAGTLADEVAFGLESVGWPAEGVLPRVLECLRLLGLPPEPDRSPRALSGGQRQRLVVAAALAGGAGLLLLDEPLSQLDPAGARALLLQLRRAAQSGVAVLMVEHRLAACLEHVDRALVMDRGQLVADARPEALDHGLLRGLGLHVPGAPVAASSGSEPSPVAAVSAESPVLVDILSLNIQYDRLPALQGVTLQVRAGERLALIGANGSGKSTLLGAISGRIRSDAVRRSGRVVEVPQEADLTLFCETVAEELAYGPREAGATAAARQATVARVAEGLSVTELLDRAPQALSRGQRSRVAVAAALSVDAGLVLLDEPTAGQDHGQVERMMEALERTLGADAALVFATHDLELARRHATRWVVMEEGRVIADGRPAELVGRLPASLRAEAGEGEADEGEALRAPREAHEARKYLTKGFVQDPRARLGLLMAASLACLALDRPLSLGLLCLLTASPLLFLRVERRWLLGGALAALTLVWSTTLSQGLFYSDEPKVVVATLGPLRLVREGLWHGLVQSLRLLSMTLGGLALSLSTSPDRLFSALQAIRVPFGVGFLAVTALRFVPEVGREWLTVRTARAARGRPMWRRAPPAWIGAEVALLRPVVARSLRRARALAESLDARGFDPLVARTRYRPLRMGRLEGALLAFSLVFALTLAGARLLYVLYTAELLYLPSLRPLYGLVRSWL